MVGPQDSQELSDLYPMQKLKSEVRQSLQVHILLLVGLKLSFVVQNCVSSSLPYCDISFTEYFYYLKILSFVCVYDERKGGSTTHMQRSEDNRGCQSLLSPYLEQGLLFVNLGLCEESGLRGSRASPLPTSHLQWECWDYRHMNDGDGNSAIPTCRPSACPLNHLPSHLL